MAQDAVHEDGKEEEANKAKPEDERDGTGRVARAIDALVGNGDGSPSRGEGAAAIWRDATAVRTAVAKL